MGVPMKAIKEKPTKTSKPKATKKVAVAKVAKEEPVLKEGIYSTRHVQEDGSVNLIIDWDKLKEQNIVTGKQQLF